MSGVDAIAGKHIVLGVSGSIACYKAADIASKLMQAGALVDVVLTRAAQEFVTPLTFRSLTHRPVITDMFDAQSEDPLEHVEVARRADAVVIAPATAHVMAKLAHGLADDALSTIVLARLRPCLLLRRWNTICGRTRRRRRTWRRCGSGALCLRGRMRGGWPPALWGAVGLSKRRTSRRVEWDSLTGSGFIGAAYCCFGGWDSGAD